MVTYRMFLTASFVILLIGVASDGMAAERGRGCRSGDRIRIQDLDMSPDPVVQGQRVKAWRVKIRLDGNRDCDTEVEIRDGDNNVVAREDNYKLRPGINEIPVRPNERYNFQRGEHCMTVQVNIEGSRRRVDADRQFCARQKPAWSMREQGDRK